MKDNCKQNHVESDVNVHGCNEAKRRRTENCQEELVNVGENSTITRGRSYVQLSRSEALNHVEGKVLREDVQGYI